MLKKLTAFLTSTVMAMSVASMPILTSYADTNSNTEKRVMEKLDRGTVAVKTNGGVYLSWRLLGTESLTNQAFDIYRDGEKIYTTGEHDATCYTDSKGTADNSYIVVRKGEATDGEKAVKPSTIYCKNSSSSPSESNSYTYTDIPIVKPEGGTAKKDDRTTGQTSEIEYTYSANDASVGDLDGDGDYELVLKWNPSNAEDSGSWDGNYTGNVYIDGYQIDSENKNYMWRIDLGVNIRAGAHYTQFIVYDLDGDGKSEIAMKTAPGSKDGTGAYVTEVGDTDEIRNADNTIDYREAEYGGSLGRIYQGPEYLTVFDGETGKALCTTDYIPRGDVKDWGDGGANRSERYLAGVAYLDGVHPSLVMTRGYYAKAVIRTYSWDGKNLKQIWECNGTEKGEDSLYGQGNHQLAIADIDNDGLDEIVYGSTSIDNDGTIVGNTLLGHGDALHVSDFNNDGVQEAFSVQEEAEGFEENAANLRIASTGQILWGHGANDDTGRGVMANIDDDYASKNSNALALAWSSSHSSVFDLNGNEVNVTGAENGAKPNAGSKTMTNFLVYWDGDLGRELLDGNILAKYHVETNYTTRFYTNTTGSFSGVHANNSTKDNPSLVADIWGDWREEIVMPTSDDGALRIFTSAIPTDYRLTTLMHDSQYRCAIAWQNVGYNQPPHTSYYIGSASLATDSDGNTLNYLAPNTSFTKVTYPDTSLFTPRPTVKATTAPVTVTADADTYLVDSTTAHGTDEELKINQAQNVYTSSSPGLKDIKGLGLIRFDLSKYAGKKLVSATLNLYDKFSNTEKKNSVLHLDYCSKNDWDEATVTTNDITVRGENTPLSSLDLQNSPPYSTDYKEVSFDVTEAIKNKCVDNLITFTLWTGTAREQVIASKEYSGTDAQGPTLVLTFEEETPTPTPTASPTVTPTVKPTATPTVSPTVKPTATPTVKPTQTPAAVSTSAPTTEPIKTTAPTIPTNNKITAVINNSNKLDVTLDFTDVDMNDVNVYIAFKNNGKLVGLKMPQTSELKGIELIDKEYTDIEVYAWDKKQKPYADVAHFEK